MSLGVMHSGLSTLTYWHIWQFPLPVSRCCCLCHSSVCFSDLQDGLVVGALMGRVCCFDLAITVAIFHTSQREQWIYGCAQGVTSSVTLHCLSVANYGNSTLLGSVENEMSENSCDGSHSTQTLSHDMFIQIHIHTNTIIKV